MLVLYIRARYLEKKKKKENTSSSLTCAWKAPTTTDWVCDFPLENLFIPTAFKLLFTYQKVILTFYTYFN